MSLSYNNKHNLPSMPLCVLSSSNFSPFSVATACRCFSVCYRPEGKRAAFAHFCVPTSILDETTKRTKSVKQYLTSKVNFQFPAQWSFIESIDITRMAPSIHLLLTDRTTGPLFFKYHMEKKQQRIIILVWTDNNIIVFIFRPSSLICPRLK